MTKKDIENKVANSFQNAKPDVYAAVSEQCPARVIAPAATPKKANGGWKISTCVLALVLVAIVLTGGVMLILQSGQNAVAADVTLDVNPSVSVQINGDRRVVNVHALNDDGQRIIGDMDLRGTQLNVAVNALIGSMLRNGYLSDLSNSVLVSVDAGQNEYDELVAIVTQEIQLKLKESEINASVVSQWIRESDAANRLAQQLDISVGKAQLITKILNNAPQSTYTAEQLAKLSVNDLNLILQNLNIPTDELSHSGNASEAQYIGRDAAINAALQTVEGQPEASAVQRLTCKMDNDGGLMIYEVEFVYDGWEYEIEVNAVNGEIAVTERERDLRDPDKSNGELKEADIRALVCKMLGIEPSENFFQVSFDRDDKEYEVKVNNEGKAYTLEFDVYGNLLSYKEQNTQLLPAPDGSWSGSYGTNDDAFKQYILQQLRGKYGEINIADTFDWSVETDTEHRRMVYEVEFKWRKGNAVYEFECDVDYQTMELLRCTCELDD